MDIFPTKSHIGLPVTWQPRPVPLMPRALACRGAAAHKLARRLLTYEAERLAALQGVSAPGLLVVLGETEALPWVENGVYLGREAAASVLLIPTTLASAVPLALLERALPKPAVAGGLPLAVVPDWNLLIPLGAARPLARVALRRWLDEEAG